MVHFYIRNIARIDLQMSKPKSLSEIGRSPAFPLPFTRDQLRLDILNIVLCEMRRLRHITFQDANFPGFENGSVGEIAIWDAGLTTEEIGIYYDQIKDYSLTQALEDQYDFAFYAVTGTRSDPLDWDTIHTWISAYLVDVSRSMYASEWGDGEGHNGLMDGIKRCLFTCQLANSRVILEGGEPFYHFSGVSGAKENDKGGFGELSIRQVAMLSGIEEMSLRSAISRKTPPVLEIRKDARSTFIEPEVARQWLIAKGRYLPVMKGSTSAELDLSITRFESSAQFQEMLRNRISFIRDKAADSEKFQTELESMLVPYGELETAFALEPRHEVLSDAKVMEKLANLLELPANFFILRAREAVLKTEIWERDSELKELQKLQLCA